MNRLVVYCRVSSEDQKTYGYSLSHQEELCVQWAEEHNCKVVEVIQENYTGTSLDRPGLKKALGKIESGLANGLICYTPDRLSRILVHRVILRDEIQRMKAELVYATTGIVGDTPADVFMDNIHGSVSQYELEMIRARTLAGRIQKAKEGKIIGFGVPPFGYKQVGKKKEIRWVIDEEEAKVVRLIFEKYIEGERVHNIAAHLTRHNVPSRGDKTNNTKKRRGWSVTMIYKILNKEEYTGRYYHWRNSKDGLRPRDEWLEVEIPAIITEKQWQQVENIRSRSKQKSGRTRSKHEFLALGVIKCSCGYSFTSSTKIGKRKASENIRYYYYRCSGHVNKYQIVRHCDARDLNAELVDVMLWAWVVERMVDLDNLRLLLDREVKRSNTKHKRLHDRIDLVEKKIEDADHQISRWLDLYGDNRVPRKVLDEKLDLVNNFRSEFVNELHELQLKLNRLVMTAKDVDVIMALADDINDRLPYLTIDKRQDILKVLDVRVVAHTQPGEDKHLEVSSLLGETIIDVPDIPHSQLRNLVDKLVRR